MKQKILLLFFSILLSYGLYAQGEASHWYFGRSSGIDFTRMTTRSDVTINGSTNEILSGIPAFDKTGPITTDEGCFSISDKNGNFLFASDGMRVYGKNKVQMPNGSGLKGHTSATQSGIVIPRPNHPNNFYIVSVSAWESPYAICVYEVDMTANGGNGDLLCNPNGTVKSTVLNFDGIYPINQQYENIAAVKHANGKDFWLAHRCRDYIFIWEVTENGIDATPTKKHQIGYDPGIPSASVYTAGHLKFSSNGKYIAHIHSTPASIIAGKFDDSTGDIVGLKNHILNPTSNAYGLVFSPSNKYIYYTYYATGKVYRRTLESFLNDTAESALPINQYMNNIQLGPDNRIYGIITYSNYGSPENTNWRNLPIILNPDDENIDIAVVPNYYEASNGASLTGTHLSFPTFTSSFFYTGDIESTPVLPICVDKNEEITFSTQISAGSGENTIIKIEWDFGDGTSIITDTNMSQLIFTQKHTYPNKPGKYIVTLTPYKSDNSVITSNIKTFEVKINSCVLPVNHNISVMGYYD